MTGRIKERIYIRQRWGTVKRPFNQVKCTFVNDVIQRSENKETKQQLPIRMYVRLKYAIGTLEQKITVTERLAFVVCFCPLKIKLANGSSTIQPMVY